MKQETGPEAFTQIARRSTNKIVRTILLRGADELTIHGYVQTPKWVLRNPKISPGAKCVYSLLLSYAWRENYCFPGQETLARDMGAGVRSVVRYVKELEESSLLRVRRQGQGRPNIYELFLTVSEGRVIHRKSRASD